MSAFLFAFLFFPVVGQYLFAQNTVGGPRLSPDPRAHVVVDNFDPSDWRSLFELAYWGSGASGWDTAADNFAPVLEDLSASVASMDDRHKAEAVLEYMHKHFLRAYQFKQSRLDTLFASGRYNCLSSAVLYTIMGTATGLQVSGVSTIDHAFCSVRIDGEQIDVETTNPYGFDPGNKIEFHDNFGSVTGFSYVPQGNYRDRADIDILRLFSLLFQNRIADAEHAGRYAEAVGLAADRWALLGSVPGQEFEDLVVRMLNYGTMLSKAGREDEALAWAELAIQAYGPHPKWNDFVDGIVNNLLIKLLRRGRIEEARSRYLSLKPRLTAAASEAMDRMVSDSELVAALDAAKAGGPDSDFVDALDKARQRRALSAERIREVELNWRLYRIDLIAKTEGWAAAFDATEAAISEMGNNPVLTRARRIYLENQKAELYNSAVEAFNSRRYEEARALAENAILKFPDEVVFQSLMKNIDRVLAGN